MTKRRTSSAATPNSKHDGRAEVFNLAREFALASISIGVAINSPTAIRGFVQAAREFISEVDVPTPLPTPPKPGESRPGSVASASARDVLDELSEE